MRLLYRIAALSVLGLVLGVALAEERGVRVIVREREDPAAPGKEIQLYRASHALVVGIDAYQAGWPRLSNAVRDSGLVAKELRSQGFDVTEQINLNSAALKQTLEEFFILKGEDPESRLFVWFAGHGHTQDGEGYLIPADAPLPSQAAAFLLKALSVRRFGEFVRQARAKHVLAVFDSCFAGTVFQSVRGVPPAAITRATTFPVRQFITSGEADQQVSDDGTFRKLFLRALVGEESNADANRDGYLTGDEMGLFLTDRLTNLTSNRQTPRYGKLTDPNWDRGDFVFPLAQPPPLSDTGARPPTSSGSIGFYPEKVVGRIHVSDRVSTPMLSPDGRFLYTKSSNGIDVIDTQSMVSVGYIPVGTNLQAAAISRDGSLVYVLNPEPTLVRVVDVIKRSVVQEFPYPRTKVCQAAVTPNGEQLLITLVEGSVAIINLRTRAITTQKLDTTTPCAIGMSRHRFQFHVSSSPDELRVFSLYSPSDSGASLRPEAVIRVGRDPVGIAEDAEGSRIYVANRGGDSVSVIDGDTKSLVGTVPVGGSPWGIDVTPDGKRIYVANRGSGTISIIDANATEVVQTIRVDADPIGLVVAPDGQSVYVTHSYMNSVTVIR